MQPDPATEGPDETTDSPQPPRPPSDEDRSDRAREDAPGPSGDESAAEPISAELRERGHELAPEESTVTTQSGERAPQPRDAGEDDMSTHLETADRLAAAPRRPGHGGDRGPEEPGRRPPSDDAD